MPRAAETIEQRITRRFFARFKSECEKLSDLIKGIAQKDARQQHASILLIRLMFLRFVQSKGLLEGDTNYLRTKLAESKRAGRDRFYSQMLCPLFSSESGFAGEPDVTRESNSAASAGPPIADCLSSLFLPHETGSPRAERIQIPDAAFEKMFDFFDRYSWRLESRSPSNDQEITPGILGRILELRINQKQMGAYYTGDDITEHIAKNTIIPFLFDSTGRDLNARNEDCAAVWQLLQADPDRYIYQAFKKGIEQPVAPEMVASLRPDRNSNCPENIALRCLPAETPREMFARRQRLKALRSKLERGEVRCVNDAVTCNLDLRRFARDAIENCKSACALINIWRALERITILDPTCGSGAFLFAALNILEPLYEACLERMRLFLSAPELCDAESISQLRKVADGIGLDKKRAGGRSFILKTIISNNLFGVDIMQEAVEVCRLRFFLTLLASLGDDQRIEQVSEVDFNIRAGNALLGYVTCEDEKNTLSKGKLNRRLALECAIDWRERSRWVAESKPFHWAAEFPRIIARGGFDVVIGNPPYLSAHEFRNQYVTGHYKTSDCPDIFAWVLERTCHLLRRGGRSGQIVPLSLTFSRDFDSCRSLIFQSYGENWFSSFARIPCALFNFDVRVRNTIHIGHKSENPARSYTTRLHRWFESARPHLFEMIEYAPFAGRLWQNKIPKLGSEVLSDSFERCLLRARSKLSASLVKGPTPYALHFKRSAYNWLSFCRRLPPCYDQYGNSIPQPKTSTVYFADACQRDLAFLLLNGKLMLVFWTIVGDDFDLTRWMFADFPADLSSISNDFRSGLAGLADRLETLMGENIVFKLNAGKRVGNYNLAKCREVTDLSDLIFARHLGIEAAWSEVELLYAQIVLTEFDDARGPGSLI